MKVDSTKRRTSARRTIPVLCAFCGQATLQTTYAVNRARMGGWSLFCDIKCSAQSRRRVPLPLDRQLEQVFCDLVRDGKFRVDEQGRIWRGDLSGERRAEHQMPLPDNYLHVRFVYNGARRTVTAHRCVYALVHGSISDDLVINHLNGVKDDNRPANLELVTQSENRKHAWATGLIKCRNGERYAGAKLSDDEVAALRTDYAAGQHTQTDLAKRLGVSVAAVSRIIKGHARAAQGGPIVRNLDLRQFSRQRDEHGRFIGYGTSRTFAAALSEDR